MASPSLTSQDVRLQAEAQPSSAQSLVQAIRKLQSGKGWGKTSKKLTRQERDDLKAFYEADGQKPLWFTQDGINGAARALLAEFGNADAFGLRARDYAVSADVTAAPSPEALAKHELALTATALIYARHAKAGRASSKKLGRQLPYKPQALPPREVLAGLQAAADPSQYLRALHPQHPQFVKLQRKLAELREPQRPGAGPRIPTGPVLKPGMSHPHVALLRQRLGAPAADQAAGDDNAFDTALAAAVKKFQRENGLSCRRHRRQRHPSRAQWAIPAKGDLQDHPQHGALALAAGQPRRLREDLRLVQYSRVQGPSRPGWQDGVLGEVDRRPGQPQDADLFRSHGVDRIPSDLVRAGVDQEERYPAEPAAADVDRDGALQSQGQLRQVWVQLADDQLARDRHLQVQFHAAAWQAECSGGLQVQVSQQTRGLLARYPRSAPVQPSQANFQPRLYPGQESAATGRDPARQRQGHGGRENRKDPRRAESAAQRDVQ